MEFYSQMETHTHTSKEAGTLCLCFGHKQSDSQTPKHFTSSGRGTIYLSKVVCAGLGWMLWLKAKISYSESYTNAVGGDGGWGVGDTIKTKMSHKPEPPHVYVITCSQCHYEWTTVKKPRKLVWTILSRPNLNSLNSVIYSSI